jgi:hypothetical protein
MVLAKFDEKNLIQIIYSKTINNFFLIQYIFTKSSVNSQLDVTFKGHHSANYAKRKG